MNDINSRLAAVGVGIPGILLPRDGIDLSKWAVIACDQFTQDRDYWERVKNAAAGSPSCLNMVFPEVYLEDGGASGRDLRIRGIRDAMASYVKDGVFAPPRRCCVYLERSTPLHPVRQGLVLLVDLEQYDWTPGSRALIRSTEGTVEERLPPRMEIRRGAPLELPHILLLIDDKSTGLIPSLGEIARKRPPLYHTPLMQDSGELTGWAVDTGEAFGLLAAGLEKLAAESKGRYGPDSGGEPFLFAMGDGNHSLATAKAVWEEFKNAHAGAPGLENHPARWALVEVENLYDPGISFEPIHRVIFGAGPEEVMEALSALKGFTCRPDPACNTVIRVESASPGIAAASLQPLLDSFVKRKSYPVDYIHGGDETRRLAAGPDRKAVGLILPPIVKDGLFETVARTGPLPRKSFSMGEACEKRFYLECRKLSG